MYRLRCLPLASLVIAVAGNSLINAQDLPGTSVRFKKTVLDTVFRSEGVAVGDFNQDGKQDIAAGYVWYAAPDWKMHLTGESAPEHDPHGYSNSFQTFVDDLNKDGWDDILVVNWPGTQTWWLENPKRGGTVWPKHTLTPVTNNESPQYVDVDGDGQRDLLAAFAPDPQAVDGPERRMGFMSRGKEPAQPWTIHAVSSAGAPSSVRYAHGLGLGDINGDDRGDIVVPQGWWEAPRDINSADRTSGEWKFHSAPLGEPCAQMYVYDFDGDGDSDVLSTAAHALGMWWHEQLEAGQWKTHEISREFSQSHALCLADINGDGLPDFVSGKRWWAHGPKGDINPDHPAVLYWFELKREGEKPEWIPHQIDHDSGVGTQFEVADVNGDGLLDIVTANKKGAFLFEQVRD